jgi:pimeloyl-ACP methyl ester carboxylesterase
MRRYWPLLLLIPLFLALGFVIWVLAGPEISNWAIAGHSLGGAMAANFADGHPGSSAIPDSSGDAGDAKGHIGRKMIRGAIMACGSMAELSPRYWRCSTNP